LNLYSNKQRWKIILFLVAMVIVIITLWYSNHIASGIQTEERNKVELWSKAITRRAELVNFTQELFERLSSEERKKADLLGKSYNILQDPSDQNDLTFVTDFIWSNTTVPILIYDVKADSIINSANLPEGKESDLEYIDSLFVVMKAKYAPIEFEEVGHQVYYNDSYIFAELKHTMDDLINSFILETVINSASVPVIMTDSTKTQALKFGNIDTTLSSNSAELQKLIAQMEKQNEPLKVKLPGQGTHYIFFEDSAVLKQLKMFPVFQLILIGVFLLVAYLIFSTFRKAEQNQVWVGMAKETAHQLGTPLSSLMAWSTILEDQGVDKKIITELNKDLERLSTITDRFSKIGSTADLTREDVNTICTQAVEYLRPRVSSRVSIDLTLAEGPPSVLINKPLFGWVLENLVKNAVDAMEGEGQLVVSTGVDITGVYIDITDSGKGIPKGKWKTVFQPGYTTKKRGWGLGLSLVKRIVENYHHGRIFVKWSEPGKGTTFRIEFKE
jgi:two-component system, sporulation sensor kinase D